MSSDEVRVLRPSRKKAVGFLVAGLFIAMMGFLFFATSWWGGLDIYHPGGPYCRASGAPSGE
jgi:hypothetical protein